MYHYSYNGGIHTMYNNCYRFDVIISLLLDQTLDAPVDDGVCGVLCGLIISNRCARTSGALLHYYYYAIHIIMQYLRVRWFSLWSYKRLCLNDSVGVCVCVFVILPLCAANEAPKHCRIVFLAWLHGAMNSMPPDAFFFMLLFIIPISSTHTLRMSSELEQSANWSKQRKLSTPPHGWLDL